MSHLIFNGKNGQSNDILPAISAQRNIKSDMRLNCDDSNIEDQSEINR